MTLIAALLLSPLLLAAESPVSGRFFREGDGEVTLYSQKNGRSGKIRYRNSDGTYSEEGLREINRIFDVPEGSTEGISLRFLSLIDFLEDHFKSPPLITRPEGPLRGRLHRALPVEGATQAPMIEILSGYRDPEYNEKLKKKGAKVARVSLHLDGEAADLIFPNTPSQKVWDYVRTFDCCGVGIYRNRGKYPTVGGTVHVDTGPKRYWTERTTGTEKIDLRKNHMIIAQTDRDIYFPGETVSLKLARVTDYPFVADPEIEILDDSGKPKKFLLERADDKPLQITDRPGRLSTLRWKIPADFSSTGPVMIRVKFPKEWRKDFPDMKESVVSNPIRIVTQPDNGSAR